MIQWPSLRISPHPLAPMYSLEKDPALVLQQAVSEITSQGGFKTTEEVRQLLRQTGFVSLWFYLRFICSYSGPYDALNEGLHVDMCNFRQVVTERPGGKFAMFLPRAAYKSTIGTHGANPWELLRNPDLRIGCTSEIFDRAMSFVSMAISTFRDNELHQWLYPEYQKANRDDVELVLANRRKRYVEPNLKAITAGGSVQGIHVDLFDCDDIVGDDMLNGDHASGADMLKMGNWLHENMNTLVVNPSKSRVLVLGTRYAIDDPYESIMKHTREQWGFWDDLIDDYPVDENGEWVTYYRPALQNGESINPDAYDPVRLAKMREENPWLYYTQYLNRPYSAKDGDFGQYRPQKCKLTWDSSDERYYVLFPGGDDLASPPLSFKRSLASADVVAAGDPAASSKRVGIRTSKSATGVIARWADDTVAVLEVDKGYVEPTRFFDWLYSYKDKYRPFLRGPYIEAQAGFKAFIPIARREALIRGKELNAMPVPALGDKEATIRNILQPYLARNKLFIKEEIYDIVMDELRVFPSYKMDILDMIKIAIFKSIKPDSLEEEDDDDEESCSRKRSSARRSVSNVSGY